MKAVYKLRAQCNIVKLGIGDLEGLFVAEVAMVEALIESQMELEIKHFGQIAKGGVKEKEVTLVSAEPIVVKMVEEYELSHGLNPLNFRIPGKFKTFREAYRDKEILKKDE